MLLKKQTVWLLTMLSLVVVLTVYYTTSPEQNNELAQNTEEMATDESVAENTESTVTENTDDTVTESTEDGSTLTTTTSDEIFEEMRIALEEERSRKEEELTVTLAEAETAEEKSAAQDEITQLQELSDNEKMMESLIKAENYEDVFVKTVDGTVNVTVKAEELSAEAANDIVQLVRKNLNQPNALVAVKIDPK